jgi:hypothetical protein
MMLRVAAAVNPLSRREASSQTIVLIRAACPTAEPSLQAQFSGGFRRKTPSTARQLMGSLHLYGLPARLEVPWINLYKASRQDHGRRGPQEPLAVLPKCTGYLRARECLSSWKPPLHGWHQWMAVSRTRSCSIYSVAWAGSWSAPAVSLRALPTAC